MFTIRPIGDDDYVIKPSAGTSGNWWSIQTIILWPRSDNAIRVGDPPVTRHLSRYHDRDCSHLNVKGELVASCNMITTTIRQILLGASNQKHLSGPMYRDSPKYEVTYNRVNPTRPKTLTGTVLVYKGVGDSRTYSGFSYIDNSRGYVVEYGESTYEIIWKNRVTLVVRYKDSFRSKRTVDQNWSEWTVSGTVQEYRFVLNGDGRPTSCSTWQGQYSSSPALFSWGKATLSLVTNASSICLVSGLGKVARGPFDNIDIDLHDWFWSLSQVIPEPPDNIWGDLAQTATDDAKAVDVNSPLYIQDLFKIKDCLLTIRSVIHHPDIKKISHAYLAYKYGLSLTYSDTKEIFKAAKRIYSSERPRYTSCRSMDVVVGTVPFSSRYIGYADEYHYKIYYDPLDGTFWDYCRVLFNWDFFPSLQNCWDMIPFSFVVDWLLDVESYLSDIDTKTYISVLNVRNVLKSRKITFDSIDVALLERPLLGMDLSGTLSVSYYDRRSQKTCDIPSPRFDVPHSFNNWVEASALLVSKQRR